MMDDMTMPAAIAPKVAAKLAVIERRRASYAWRQLRRDIRINREILKRIKQDTPAENKALKGKPLKYRTKFLKAHKERKNFVAALVMEPYLKHRPDDSVVRCMYATALYGSGRTELAIGQARRAYLTARAAQGRVVRLASLRLRPLLPPADRMHAPTFRRSRTAHDGGDGRAAG